MSVPGGSGFEPSGVHGQPRRWQLRPLSEATPRQVRWLLPGLIPLRFLTLVAGVGGLGKSTWLVSVAAQGSVADAPWETIYVSFEDSADEVLRPRLEAAGGNPERVHEVVLAESGSLDAFTLPRDIDNLTTLVRSSSARLVVIDPVVAAVDTKLDAYKDQHVRQVLERLWQVAKDEDCAIALVGHLNRVPSTDAYLRIANPTAFWNAARSVVLVTEDGDADNGLRLIAQRKANLARLAPVERHRIVEFVLPDTVDPETGSPIVTSRMTFVEIADDVDPTTILRGDDADENGERRDCPGGAARRSRLARIGPAEEGPSTATPLPRPHALQHSRRAGRPGLPLQVAGGTQRGVHQPPRHGPAHSGRTLRADKRPAYRD